jgi:c(7)-type cytochrome triheme protein
MRSGALVLIALLAGTPGRLFSAEEKKPPDNLVFQAKNGSVSFNHRKHVDAVKGDCRACHPTVFPQSTAPLNYKANVHKTAEAAKKSCAVCHVGGGSAFLSNGNCGKCHVKSAAPAKGD